MMRGIFALGLLLGMQTACNTDPNSCSGEGTRCRDGVVQIHEINGVQVVIDASCTNGYCFNDICQLRTPRWDPENLVPAMQEALDKIQQETDARNCMGEPVRERMIQALRRDGIRIICRNSRDTSGDGLPDCASAPLGGAIMTLSTVPATGCGTMASLLRHEMQHGAGEQGHTRSIAEDPVYGCDEACFRDGRGASEEQCQ